jgi:hypothetical protein
LFCDDLVADTAIGARAAALTSAITDARFAA